MLGKYLNAAGAISAARHMSGAVSFKKEGQKTLLFVFRIMAGSVNQGMF